MCYILQCDAGGPDLRFPREKPECIGETSRDDAFHKVTMSGVVFTGRHVTPYSLVIYMIFTSGDRCGIPRSLAPDPLPQILMMPPTSEEEGVASVIPGATVLAPM
jgi:hypothetical protein